MNKNSLLCRYLSEHPDWEDRLWEEYGLKVKRDGVYAIFNYGYDSHFADPLVQEARGIILDTEKQEVVCWPFRKFGNFQESYADPIDWDTARVQEKIDGSIIKLWYSQRQERWIFSTNSVIDAANAVIEKTGIYPTYLAMIRHADNYRDIPMDDLDKEKTYIFELVGPDNQVVVYYDRPMLYHTGTRHNVTGQETEEDIGIIKPEQYPLHSLKDCIEAARRLNADKKSVEHEGFVVVDTNWNRVKIKNPDYLVKHKIAAVYLSPENCLDLIMNSGYTITELCEMRPGQAAILKYYDWQLEEMLSLADRVAEMARALYEEYSHDRGAVAKELSGHPLAYIGFHALQNNKPGRELILEKPLLNLKKLIQPYSEAISCLN